MKPKVMHQEAMDYSFKARQALEQGLYGNAFELYTKAAELESQVAEFYFDKPDLEPTRSVVIRSAAFLNIKAGLVENAKRFICFGLLNSKDEQNNETDENGYCTNVPSMLEYWAYLKVKEAIESKDREIAQLREDKRELVEGLEYINNNNFPDNDGMYFERVESACNHLIQKHKQ